MQLIYHTNGTEATKKLTDLIKEYCKFGKPKSSLKVYDGVVRVVCEGTRSDLLDCYKFVLDAETPLNENELEVETDIRGLLLKINCWGVRQRRAMSKTLPD